MRKNKKPLDVKLLAILKALNIAKNLPYIKNRLIAIFCDLQKVLKMITFFAISSKNRFSPDLIYQLTLKLKFNTKFFIFKKILSYSNSTKNDKVDLAVKNIVVKSKKLIKC